MPIMQSINRDDMLSVGFIKHENMLASPSNYVISHKFNNRHT